MARGTADDSLMSDSGVLPNPPIDTATDPVRWIGFIGPDRRFMKALRFRRCDGR
jgi:hypothetical protein